MKGRKPINDCSFQVKSLNLVLCAMLISVFSYRRGGLIGGLSDISSFIALSSFTCHFSLANWCTSLLSEHTWRQQLQWKLPFAEFNRLNQLYSLEKTALAWNLGDGLQVSALLVFYCVTLKKSSPLWDLFLHI